MNLFLAVLMKAFRIRFFFLHDTIRIEWNSQNIAQWPVNKPCTERIKQKEKPIQGYFFFVFYFTIHDTCRCLLTENHIHIFYWFYCSHWENYRSKIGAKIIYETPFNWTQHILGVSLILWSNVDGKIYAPSMIIN